MKPYLHEAQSELDISSSSQAWLTGQKLVHDIQ
jgi:hypothetical protein